MGAIAWLLWYVHGEDVARPCRYWPMTDYTRDHAGNVRKFPTDAASTYSNTPDDISS